MGRNRPTGPHVLFRSVIHSPAEEAVCACLGHSPLRSGFVAENGCPINFTFYGNGNRIEQIRLEVDHVVAPCTGIPSPPRFPKPNECPPGNRAERRHGSAADPDCELFLLKKIEIHRKLAAADADLFDPDRSVPPLL